MERSSEVKKKGNDAIQCILRKNSQLGGLDDLNENSFSGMLQAEPIGLTDLSKALTEISEYNPCETNSG